MSDPNPVENAKVITVLLNPSDAVASITSTQDGTSTTTTVDVVEGDLKQTMDNINAAVDSLE